MTTLQNITLAIALLGAVLGIINTWNALDTRRVKMKVIPKLAEFLPSGGKTICIEVVNLSAFPITVCQVGFLKRWSSVRGAIIRPIILDDGDFPRRLEPRSAFTAYTKGLLENPVELRNIRCAYAETECGTVRKGHSGALKSAVLLARKFKITI